MLRYGVLCKTAYLHYYLYLPQNPALGKLSRPPRVCDGSGAKKEKKDLYNSNNTVVINKLQQY